MINRDGSVTAELCDVHPGKIRICFTWFIDDDHPKPQVRMYHRAPGSPSLHRIARLAFDAWYYGADVQPLLLGLGWRFQHEHTSS